MLRSIFLVLIIGMGASVMADEQVRTITVSGSGSSEIEPDRATLQMSINAREPTLAAAQKAAADVTNKVLKMADRMDIDRDQIDTTGASVRPDYRWDREKEEQVLRGYIADRQITIEIDELEKLGAVIEGAVSAGVNQVQPPQLDSSKRKETERAALRAAAGDAKANAMELAESLDTGLGRVLSINSSHNAPHPPTPYPVGARAMSADSGAAESYNAANLNFDATVTVIFELSD